MTTTV